jgi:hypothetical protein
MPNWETACKEGTATAKITAQMISVERMAADMTRIPRVALIGLVSDTNSPACHPGR